MTINNIEISKLTLLEKNPRKITKEQFEKLCKSLQDDPAFFDARPCLVNEIDGKHIVYAGNQRVRAAKRIGWKTVPCIVGFDLCEEIMNSRIIKDNKTYGEFDFDILGNEYDIGLLIEAGFTSSELSLDCRDIEDLGGGDEPKEKKKKQKMCPNCGHEL